MSTALVEVKGLAKGYEGTGQASSPEVLRDIDLEIHAGESIAVIGPSGSGKSTLLNIIGALLPPTSGSVRFDGTDLATMDRDQLAAFRNTEIGYVFQSHFLLPQCTALENVLIPTLAQKDKTRRSEAVDRATTLLSDVGLGERLSHRPAQLSGGECQRVAVVRALINEPRLLLADEPTGSLDSEASERMGEMLSELNARETVALLLITHSKSLAARMQRTHELRDGRLISPEA